MQTVHPSRVVLFFFPIRVFFPILHFIFYPKRQPCLAPLPMLLINQVEVPTWQFHFPHVRSLSYTAVWLSLARWIDVSHISCLSLQILRKTQIVKITIQISENDDEIFLIKTQRKSEFQNKCHPEILNILKYEKNTYTDKGEMLQSSLSKRIYNEYR